MRRLRLSLLVAVLALAACSKSEPIGQPPDERPPDFVLSDPDGNAFQLSSTEGKVVLLTFFASWCGSCRAEAPLLGELYRTYKDQGFEIVAVAVNSSIEDTKAFIEAFDVPYLIVMDNNVVSRFGYGVSRVPTNYFISRDVFLIGPYGPLGKEDFEDQIKKLL